MTSSTSASLAPALALALALAPVEAAAWCVYGEDPTTYAKFWRTRFPDLRIPVYVATGYHSAFAWTGFTGPQIEAIVARTIAVHNETVGVPTLYYAGTTTQELDDDGRMRARPHGIVVDSVACAAQLAAPRCAANQVACTVAGGNSDDLVAKARVTFEPNLCGPNTVAWSVEITHGTDATRVLLHEFGHALGLDHTGGDTCSGASDGLGEVGVMNTNLNYWPAYERAWRRDDLEGLRAIYGREVRHAVYTWADDAFPDAPAEAARTPLCTAMRTPPTLSSAVGGVGERPTLLLGFVDGDDRVALHEWDGANFVAPAGGAVIDRSEHGLSFAPVGVAHSDVGAADPVVMVVWSADDSRIARENRLRWALRPLAGGEWRYGYLTTPSGATQASNRVAVGHDPQTGYFVVVSTTDLAELYVTTLDGEGAQVATTVFAQGSETPVLAFDVGPPRCFAGQDGPVCTIGYTDADSRQFWPYPLLAPGWIEVAVAGDGAASLLATRRSERLVEHGLLDLAAGPGEQRGVVGGQRFDLAPGAAIPAIDGERLAAGDWPLRIGSHLLAGDRASYRIAARRLAPCGDGRVECGEQCDDGDRIDGDGCSAECALEPAGGGSTRAEAGDDATTDGTDAATGAGEHTLDDDGCGCASGPRTTGLPALLGLLGLRRRARAPEDRR